MNRNDVPVGHCIDCADKTCPTCFQTQHDCDWCVKFHAWMYSDLMEGK